MATLCCENATNGISGGQGRCENATRGHVRHHIPAETIVILVNALVLSHVRYCLPVYGNCSKKNLVRLDKVINFAARVVSGRRRYDHVADVREALGWLPARDLSSYDTLVLLQKVIIPNVGACRYCRDGPPQ